MKIILIVLALLCRLSLAEKFDFSLAVTDTASQKTSLKAYEKKGMLLLYYSLECSKCKAAVELLNRFKGKSCLNLVGVVTSSEPEATFLKNRKRPLYSYYDKFKALKEKFKIEFVPAIFLVSAEGDIVFQKQKYFKENYEDFLNVLGSYLCGGVPYQKSMTSRYYGEAVCEPCHTGIHAWWEGTKHFKAYELAAKSTFEKTGYRAGMASKVPAEMLKYCTVGFGEPGGYNAHDHQRSLLGVQCESCHGPGGPHGSGPRKDYESACIKCHDSSQDPTFNYGPMLKKLNHPKK